MLQLRCTKKVLDQFGYKSSDLSKIQSADSLLGNWYINQAQIARSKSIVVMNESTLLSFVKFGLRKDNSSNLELKVVQGITQLLQLEGFTDEKITKVVDDYLRVEVTKTDSRKALGNLNDLVGLYDSFISADGGFASCNLEEVLHRVNRTPQRNLGWKYSIDVVNDLLNEELAS